MRVDGGLQSWWALCLLVAFVVPLAGVACGGVFEEVSPPEKRHVKVILSPDFVRIGDTDVQVGAFIDVPPVGTFVTAIEMQEGIEIKAYDTRDNRGCPGTLDPEYFADTEPFRLCLTLVVTEEAEMGMRDVSFELRVGNEPVIAETPFVVLGDQ